MGFLLTADFYMAEGFLHKFTLSVPSEASLINVAIKAREEQINLFFRAVATKRSEVNLKGGLEGLSIWSRTLPRNAQKKR